MVKKTVENTRDIIIVCEDSYGLDVYTIIQEINIAGVAKESPQYRVIGFLSEDNGILSRFKLPAPFFGSISGWDCGLDAKYVLAIRIPEHKRYAAEMLKARGAAFETIMAPWVQHPSEFEHGEGCIIANYNFKHKSKFGDFVTMDTCMCESVEIGNYSTLCPFVNITTASIGERVYIGSHAAIISGRKVEDGATVYPGSIVMSNVKAGVVVAGVPSSRNLKKWEAMCNE
ncbi:MAG: hypothetical protein J6H31_16540 [Butyrivibrio sp.]|nr:hypothetical protein [Butyrivibrio sp.]